VKRGTSRKLIFLWLTMCVFISMLAFACSTPAATSTTTPSATTTFPPTQTLPPTPTSTSIPTATSTSSPVPTASTSVPSPSTPSSSVQPTLGGTLTILGSGLPAENLGYPATAVPRWNPTLPFPAVERLIAWDNSGLLVPYLATGWTWGDNGLSLTLTLRKGVKFQDGTDFNAQAVKYLLDLVKDSDRPELKGVISNEVIDDYTVKMNLKSYDALLLANLGTTVGAMVSPTAIQKYGKDYNVTHPVGTGPFNFVSWARDVNLVYQKSNGYWQIGKPYLDSIQYDFVADPLTAKAALLSGAGQILGTLLPSDAADLAKRGDFEFASSIGPLIAMAPDGGNSDSPFYDVRVRQAVAYAIDINSIIKTIGFGYLIPTNQPSAPGLWNYNPDVKGYPYDPQKAKQLLAAAGFANGFKTTIYYESQYTDIRDACVAAQSYLRSVGIDAQLQGIEMAKMTDLMTKGWKNGLIVTRTTMGTNYSPINTIERNFTTLGTNQVALTHPAEVESLMKQALAETDQKKLAKDMQDINKLLIDDYCTVIPLYSRTNMWAAYPQVHDAGWILGNDATKNPGDTWLSK
jgi:peptide/nickel transport system substrate-binding protein